MRLEGGLVFVQSVLTTMKYYLFWKVREGMRVGGGGISSLVHVNE